MSAKLGKHLGCVIASVIAVASGYSRPAGAYDPAPTIELAPQTFDTGLYSVRRAAFSHDGRLVAFLGYAAPNSLEALGITVFDVRSRRLIKTLPVPNPSSVTLEGGIAFSPDDGRLAAGANAITIWDTGTWRETGHAPGPFAEGPFGADELLGLAYTPDGQRIVAAYGKVWGPGDVHVASREEFVRLSETRRQAYANGTVPDVYQRPEIEVFDASTGTRLNRFAVARIGMRGDYSLITSGLAVSRDGGAAYVAVRDMDGLSGGPLTHLTPRITVERIDLKSGQASVVYDRRQEDGFTALAVNADRSLFATGEAVGVKEGWIGANGTWVIHDPADPVRLWSISDGGLRADLGPPDGSIRQVLFLPDGSGVVACQTYSRSHNLMAVWSIKTNSLTAAVHVETPRETLVSCALNNDGSQAVLTVPTGQAFRNLSRDTAYLVDMPSTAR